jgi:hypothetical protein
MMLLRLAVLSALALGSLSSHVSLARRGGSECEDFGHDADWAAAFYNGTNCDTQIGRFEGNERSICYNIVGRTKSLQVFSKNRCSVEVYFRPDCIRKAGDPYTDSDLGEAVGFEYLKGIVMDDSDNRPKWNQISDLKKEFMMDPTDKDKYPRVSFKAMCWPEAKHKSKNNLVRGKMFDDQKAKKGKGGKKKAGKKNTKKPKKSS